MTLKIFQVDAFSDKRFGGNPAAVVPLDKWLPDSVLQAIAAENNLAETAFIVPTPGSETDFHLRWFTPSIEVRLCGHATLATAHTLWQHLGFEAHTIRFASLSGILTVSRTDNHYTLDFPADTLESGEAARAVVEAVLGVKPSHIFKGKDDYMAVLNDEEAVLALQPDFRPLRSLEARGLIATAKGKQVDFVSRCFYPEVGVEEDPVTGSAHTTMTPYWADVLGKNTLNAIQLSARRGYLNCRLEGQRVLISGQGVTYMIGEIYI